MGWWEGRVSYGADGERGLALGLVGREGKLWGWWGGRVSLGAGGEGGLALGLVGREG